MVEIKLCLFQKTAVDAFFMLFSRIPEGAQIIFDCEAVPILIALNNSDAEFSVRSSVFRLLCGVCVTLDDEQRLFFFENGFLELLVQSIISAKSSVHIEVLGALTAILMTMIEHEKKEELIAVANTENLYEELYEIKSDDERVNALVDRILYILQEIDE